MLSAPQKSATQRAALFHLRNRNSPPGFSQHCHPEGIRFTQSALREGQGTPKDLNANTIDHGRYEQKKRATYRIGKWRISFQLQALFPDSASALRKARIRLHF
jgi:hypothetical protein